MAEPRWTPEMRAAADAEHEASVPFQHHMDPDVFWLSDPEYLKAFRDLTGDTSMTEAAFTKHDTTYPGYVNAQLGDGEMVLTVRGDPRPVTHGGGSALQCGETVQLRVPLDDWDQFIASAAQVRGAAPAMPASAQAHDPDQTRVYDGKPFPTERDPQMQRTDPSLPDDHPDNDGFWIRIADEKHDNQMADLDPGSGDAAPGDPLGQRASADLSGRHTAPGGAKPDPDDGSAAAG